MRTGFTAGKRAAVAAMAGAAAAAVVGLASPAGAAPVHSAAAAAKVTGTEHFQIMTTSPTSPLAPTITWGVFTAAGVDHQGSGLVDTLVFPGGTFKVKHTNGTGPQTFNPKTCLLTLSLHGTYTLQNGTGKYKGITGHGKYTASIIVLGAKVKGTCSQTAAPVALQQVIDASGTVTLP